jgi:WhiB family redox-sensing transcriptional regulator
MSGEFAKQDWRADALCGGGKEDPELFFPIGTSGPAMLQTEQAKAVCRRCTVTAACLEWALETGQDFGVWGGMSEDERRAVKRRGGLRVGGVAVETAVENPAAEGDVATQQSIPADVLAQNNRGGASQQQLSA